MEKPVTLGSAAWQPAFLGTQANIITQHLARLPAPYLGANSLPRDGDTQTSQAYGLYAGVQMGARLQGYLDVEMIRGEGISHATGLAGITNGDVLRQGTVDLGSGPYVARAYLRYTVPFTSETADSLARGQDQLATVVSSRRLELFAGKLAASDLFDLNRYANTTRWQFMNWGLFQNTAWDFAADTRGYSNGVAVAWITPSYAVRAGSFQMPTLANGNHFDPDLRRGRGDHVELTALVPGSATIVRVMGFVNHAQMGSYRLALDRAAAARAAGTADTIPDIVATDAPGRRKYGVGLNLEQPLADEGETGLFARLGWSDGENESFAFTEVDRHASVGLQLSGAHWGRAGDRFAVAGLAHGLVAVHQEYLAAGGTGFLLGDGRLTYGPEQILESYYRAQVGAYVQIGPNLQLIRHPGYNRDRGVAKVISLRLNVRY
jgi:high affinity Mn2+ porin